MTTTILHPLAAIQEYCRSCGSDKIWVPTFCNFAHCAGCWDPLGERHEGCGWNGSEDSSFFPLDHGNVWNASCGRCKLNDDQTACDKCKGEEEEEVEQE